MEVVGVLLSLLLVMVIPFGIVIGLIKPSLIKLNSRKQVFGYGAAAWFGCLVLVLIAVAMSPDGKKESSVSAKENAAPQKAEPAETYENRDLEWFAKQNAEDRKKVVATLMATAGLDAKELESFHTCLADFAWEKAKTLAVPEVFGWCKNEFTGQKKAFREHFNELDAPDYSLSAQKKCQHAIESVLVSPSTADFPWAADKVFYRGRLRYVFKMHVDSQNSFGAMIRSNWHCDIQYTGEGGQFDSGSWTLNALEQQG